MATEKLGRATLTGNNVTHISSAPLSSQRVPLGIPIQIIKGLLTWRWGTPGSWGNLPGHIISHMVTPSTYHVNVIKMRDDMSKRVTQPKRITSPTWGPPPCLVAVACFSFLFLSFPARFLFSRTPPAPSPTFIQKKQASVDQGESLCALCYFKRPHNTSLC